MWRSEVNDAVVDRIAPAAGERVLDVGAGMGAAVVRAARSGAAVTAVEPTPFMRRVLSARRLMQRRRGAIDVIDGAAERLGVADATIDAVWAVNTMHHWVDTERGVAEIARVLAPGGRVLLVDEDFADAAHPDHERFGARHGNGGEPGHHHGFTMVDAESMGGLLRDVGMSEVVAEKTDLAGRPAIVVTATR